MACSVETSNINIESKKEGKELESIQLSTTPDPGYQLESDNFTKLMLIIYNVKIVNVLKYLNTFPFLFPNKMFAIRAWLTKCLSEKQTGKTLIRLLLKKQSGLGLPCLSRLLWQATNY